MDPALSTLLVPGPPQYPTRGNSSAVAGVAAKQKGKASPLQKLMTDAAVMKPERRLQPMFIKGKFFSGLAVTLPIFAMAVWHNGQSNRWPGPDRVVSGRAIEVAVGGEYRAWRMTAADRRFGGLSALAVERGDLVALTDSGVVVRFAPPGASEQLRITLHDLPAGPGSPLRKSGRDSESMLADPAGRGWWVAFENRHSLWLFNQTFGRVLTQRRLDVDWSSNRGGEALVADDERVMVLPENGGPAVGGAMIAPAGSADATRLPDGRLVMLIRRIGLRGFDNQLWIGAGAGTPARRIALDLGVLDNMEGIAAAPIPDGGTRLWIVSDDNFRPWMRTLLVAFDLTPGA